jgi:hypothetical protein
MVDVSHVDDAGDVESASEFDRRDLHRERVGVNDVGLVFDKSVADDVEHFWIDTKSIGGEVG